MPEVTDCFLKPWHVAIQNYQDPYPTPKMNALPCGHCVTVCHVSQSNRCSHTDKDRSRKEVWENIHFRGASGDKSCQFYLWAEPRYSSDEINDLVCDTAWHKWRHRNSAACGQLSVTFSVTKKTIWRNPNSLTYLSPSTEPGPAPAIIWMAWLYPKTQPVLLLHNKLVFRIIHFTYFPSHARTKKPLGCPPCENSGSEKAHVPVLDKWSIPLWQLFPVFPGFFAMYGAGSYKTKGLTGLFLTKTVRMRLVLLRDLLHSRFLCGLLFTRAWNLE